MNPFGMDVQRFLVAEDSEAPGRIKGFGQLAPLGASGAMELRSLVVEPDSRSTHSFIALLPGTVALWSLTRVIIRVVSDQ